MNRPNAGFWISGSAGLESDLDLAAHLVDEGAIFPAAVAFHCQQAAEKFIKGFLIWNGIEFPKTHDLKELLDLAAESNSHLATELKESITLTPYGVELRYPGDRAEASPDEARSALVLARKVKNAILPLLC